MSFFYPRLTDLSSHLFCQAIRRGRPALWAGIGVLALVLLGHAPASAQPLEISNEFIGAKVEPSQNTGQVWIAGWPNKPGEAIDFLFNGLRTSFLVFRVKRGNDVNFGTNVPENFGWRPVAPGNPQPVPFVRYDSTYVTADTIALVYKNLYGYKVVVRYVVERPTSIYDRGADVLMECDYEPLPFAPAGEFGLFMMLDVYNRDAQSKSGGGAGDYSSILSSEGYFPTNGRGKKWQAPFDSIPEFFHVGDFQYQPPLNTIYPIFRLKGYSHGGAPLTTPDVVAIGDWREFRTVGWEPPSENTMKDVAAVLRWTSPTGGRIRTALGLNDEPANNNFICRDENLFVDIRSVRVVKQAVKNGPYTPAQVEVQMWVTNISDRTQFNPYIRLVTPIRSLPNLTGRLSLDASTPAVVPVQLAPKVTKKITWRLNVNPTSTDTLAELQFLYRPEGGNEREFRGGCKPLITVNGVFDTPPPPPQDTMPPVIQFTGPAPSRMSAPQWNFTVFDQHSGYNYDTGLDKIIVWSNDGNNFVMKTTPSFFKQCDRNVSVGVNISVTDMTKPAKLVFAVFDCKGNKTLDTAYYVPVIDPFAPEITQIDSLERNGPPCNTKVFIVTAIDSSHTEEFRKDFGFGSIEFGTPAPVNFAPLELNPLNSSPTIFAYDRKAQFRLRVIDSMQDADATVIIKDYAGNATVISFHYCTTPDTLAPVATVNVITGSTSYDREWQVDATDKRPWDRGLRDVVVISPPDPNFAFTPPAITPGDPETTFRVGLIDDSKDGQIVLEIRDTIYAQKPEGHADTVTLRFNRMPDERAPNIVFTPDPAKNGSEADVDVNDIHYDGATLYKYDLGLKSVNVVGITPNMSVTTINYSAGDSRTTFRLKVTDTLALAQRDSICIEAVDLAGNRTVNCYYYPPIPDTVAPIFIGELTADFTKITGVASDSRQYDRGLGSVTIESPLNIDPGFSMINLNGTRQTPVSINVIDPNAPIGGTLVIRDVIGLLDPSLAAQAVHKVEIPFYVPAVAVALKLPMVTEGDLPFRAAIVASDLLPTGMEGGVDSISFLAEYNGSVEFRGPENGKATLRTEPAPGGKLLVVAGFDQTLRYDAGDTLGYLVFYGIGASDISRFDLRLIRGSGTVNGGGGRVVEFRAAGDNAKSLLKLPAPTFMFGASDSMTVVNGICGRVLTAERNTGSKLAVLGVHPQPARISAGPSVEIDVKNVSQTGARAELVSADGRRVATFELAAPSLDLIRLQLQLPAELNSGVYHLRVVGENGTDVVKIVVSE